MKQKSHSVRPRNSNSDEEKVVDGIDGCAGEDGEGFDDRKFCLLFSSSSAFSFAILVVLVSFSVSDLTSAEDEVSNFDNLFGRSNARILLVGSSVWNVLFKYDLNLSNFLELATEDESLFSGL